MRVHRNLEKLLRRKTRLGNGGVPLREAVIKLVSVANANDVADLIPEIIGIQRVGAERFLLIKQLALTVIDPNANHQTVFTQQPAGTPAVQFSGAVSVSAVSAVSAGSAG